MFKLFLWTKYFIPFSLKWFLHCFLKRIGTPILFKLLPYFFVDNILQTRAKTMANRLKLVLDDLIHADQNGFMHGQDIGCNIRTILIWLNIFCQPEWFLQSGWGCPTQQANGRTAYCWWDWGLYNHLKDHPLPFWNSLERREKECQGLSCWLD